VPNGQPHPTRSVGWGIRIIIAIIVIAVVGWAWGYGGYWGTWWNKNTGDHAANTTPNSGTPGSASNRTQEPQDRQDQQSQVQHPNNQQSQQSNINQAAQTNTNQAAQNPDNTKQTNTNQAVHNQPNNEQTISPNSLSRNEVRQVQQALEKNGFRAGPIDGRWGQKTSDALKHFQQSKNIQANGQLDQQTLSDLGLNGAQFGQQNQNNSSQIR